MEKIRILYVASEVSPFLQATEISEFIRHLSQNMQERGAEIRIIVPRFGLINERKNRLHEVVRLSGINISVGDDEKPLVIKVASIPNAKLQVYFIDNEDFFQRKALFYNDSTQNEGFFEDNDERAIFFCKSTLETIKKLGWSPDVIHCNDWISSLIPLYLKTGYRKDPVFRNTKTVFSVFASAFSHVFPADMPEKVKIIDVTDEMLLPLQTCNYEGFLRLGFENADVIIKGETNLDALTETIFNEYKLKNENIHEEHSYEEYEALYGTLRHEYVTV
ncbi:MAG: glycogen synthase [Bacteroidetes bacterium]|nr:MAG: glycogen synthase [Bacteroidota bacterium]TAG87667.1 MAG: glycogen synthase [Bacteroidota bacterium]